MLQDVYIRVYHPAVSLESQQAWIQPTDRLRHDVVSMMLTSNPTGMTSLVAGEAARVKVTALVTAGGHERKGEGEGG
jgi:hypothetical protein